MRKQLQVLMQTFPKLGLVVLMMLMAVGMANAQTNTFTGSNTWNTAANWSLGIIPTTAHDAVIASGATVTGMSSRAVNVCKTLAVNGTLTFSGGTPRLITVSGSVSVASTATINMTGSNSYYIDYNGASFSVASGATLTMTSTGEAGVRYTGTSASTITNGSSSAFGSLLVSGTGVLTTGGAITFGKTITINSGCTFAASHTVTANAAVSVAGTFQINEGGFAQGTGTWTYTATTGTLRFANTTSYGVSGTPVFWPTTAGPYNVNVSGSGGINMSISRTVPTTGSTGTFQTSSAILGNAITMGGICQINTGGSFTASPTYLNTSTLIYSTGAGYGMGNEWTGNSTTAGTGIPQNVTIQTASTVLTTAAAVRGCAGTVTVNASCGLTLNASSGDLKIAGGFVQNGTFTHNSKAVFFNGAAVQTITGSGLNTAGATNCFAYFINDNTSVSGAGVTVGTNITADGITGGVVQLLNTGATTIGGFTFTVNGNGGNIQVTGGTRVVNFTSASGKLLIIGSTGTLKTVASTSAGLLSMLLPKNRTGS